MLGFSPASSISKLSRCHPYSEIRVPKLFYFFLEYVLLTASKADAQQPL